MPIPDITTDVLIIGTGPSGGSLAAFLTYYGIKPTIVSKESSTTPEPRAHVTNMATVECIRDIGLEKTFAADATDYGVMPFRRYCHTLLGQEFFRSQICNQVTDQKGDYEAASPCSHIDLPQNLAEPILNQYATQRGAKMRWNTKYISYEENDQGVLSTCQDLQTGQTLRIQSRFLCGAEGARSKLLSQIGATLHGPKEEPATCYSITFSANLADVIEKCPAFMNFIVQPDKPIVPHCMVASLRIIRPFYQFQLIAIPTPDAPVLKDLYEVDWTSLLRDLIGDPDLQLTLDIITKWRVNEVVADFYSKGNVFNVGDAVHRHPPANGLGSNTSIQDSYNLAWKIAYVLKDLAGPGILDTYTLERQLVGRQIVQRANDSWRIDLNLFEALGMFEPDLEKRVALFNLLGENSPAGKAHREKLNSAFRLTRAQFSSLGAEMNLFYQSRSVYIEDEPLEARVPEYTRDKDLYYTVGTLPGMRLPHAWVTTQKLGKTVSTHDLAGKGRFTILTGLGGKELWSDASARVSTKMPGLEIAVFGIGWGQDYLDVDNMWHNVRGIESDGAVLVRPDRIVAWRSKTRLDPEEAATKLEQAMQHILDWY